MNTWLVIIDFDSPMPMQELVRLQAQLGEEQTTLAHCDNGISVLVHAATRPELPALDVRGETPNVLIARLPPDAVVGGRAALTSWWRERN